MQAELTSNVLKTGVARCCVGQCSNAIPADTALTLRKLPITYVRTWAGRRRRPRLCHAAGRGRGRCGRNVHDPIGGCLRLRPGRRRVLLCVRGDCVGPSCVARAGGLWPTCQGERRRGPGRGGRGSACPALVNPDLCSGSAEFASLASPSAAVPGKCDLRGRTGQEPSASQLDGSAGTRGRKPSSPTGPLTSVLSSLQSNRKENKGGYLCHSCAEQRVGPLAFLTASPEQVRSMERTVEDIVLPRHEALLFLVF